MFFKAVHGLGTKRSQKEVSPSLPADVLWGSYVRGEKWMRDERTPKDAWQLNGEATFLPEK